MPLSNPPIIQLESPRINFPDWLPDDLRAFYAMYDGVGLEASVDHPVRICRLPEAAPVRLHDLHLLSHFPLDGGWDQFAAIRIGNSCFFDELVYVIHSPVCAPGSIMAFGIDVDGPGGDGSPDDPVGSLVLAASFDEWILRLQVDDWHEFGLVPGELQFISSNRADELREHFAALNPRCAWASL